MSHENERIKDKPITLHLHVRGVHRQELATVEQILEQTGVESAELLNNLVKENLETARNARQVEIMNQQVSNYLMSKVDFELPAGLSTRQSSRVLHRTAMELMQQGVREQEIQQRIAELRSASESEARRQLKLFFILDRAAKQLSVDVEEREINGRIYQIAVQQGRRPEKLRQEMMRNGEFDQFYIAVRDQKTLATILAKATVTDTAYTIEEFKKGKREG